jgi:HSP20 family protein
MRKDLTTKSNRDDRSPAPRRSSFLSPWFDDYLEPTRWFGGEDRFLAPAIDIDETDDEYIVSTDLPGVKKEDISVECVGNQLTLSAERKYESSEGKKSDRRERFYGSYQRSFTLPTGVDTDKVEASFEDGVLCVRIPKGEQAKSRRIQIGESKNRSSEEQKH